MAITITQDVGELAFQDQQLIYMASSTNIAQPNFKYIVQVYHDGAEIYKNYHPKNPSNALIFDLRHVAGHYNGIDDTNYNTASQDIFTIPHAVDKVFSRSTNACKKYEVRIGELYEVAGVLTEDLNLANHTTFIYTGKFTLNYGQVYNAPHYISNTGNQGWMLEYYGKPLIYWNDPQARGLISGELLVREAMEEDYGVISFIHDDGTNFINCDSIKVRYKIYDPAGAQLGFTQDFLINATHGAAVASSVDDEDKLIHLGAYPANLNKSNHLATQKPNATAWSYYTLQLVTSTGTEVGEVFHIVQDENCYKNKLRIAWWSDISGWEFFNLNTAVNKTTVNKSKNYQKLMGSYSGVGHAIYTHTRETVPFHSDNVLTIDSSTNWLSEYEYQFLESLISSKDVRIVRTDSIFVPVILKTTSYKHPDTNNNTKKKVKFKFEIAQPV